MYAVNALARAMPIRGMLAWIVGQGRRALLVSMQMDAIMRGLHRPDQEAENRQQTDQPVEERFHDVCLIRGILTSRRQR